MIAGVAELVALRIRERVLIEVLRSEGALVDEPLDAVVEHMGLDGLR
ncbi:hypothetical protein [Nocardiopsis xinjiangensis]|nr:hypothetical protein [Nocardiopsis xinjiangensis]